jgi:hypothetical protein
VGLAACIVPSGRAHDTLPCAAGAGPARRAREHIQTRPFTAGSLLGVLHFTYESPALKRIARGRRIESGMYQSTMYDENPGIIPLLGVMRRRYLRVFRAELQTSLERESHQACQGVRGAEAVGRQLGRRGQLMGCISSGVSGSDGDESAK